MSIVDLEQKLKDMRAQNQSRALITLPVYMQPGPYYTVNFAAIEARILLDLFESSFPRLTLHDSVVWSVPMKWEYNSILFGMPYTKAYPSSLWMAEKIQEIPKEKPVRYKKYRAKRANGLVEACDFVKHHYPEIGALPTPEVGMHEHSALQLINKWNRASVLEDAGCQYWLEEGDKL